MVFLYNNINVLILDFSMLFLLACFSGQTPSLPSSTPPQEKPSEHQPIVQQNTDSTIEIFFWDTAEQKLVSRSRSISSTNREQASLDVLYQGPQQNTAEKNLSLLTCESTGATIMSLENGLARVQLQGGCSACGSMSIYDSIVATLTQFPSITTVHVLDPQGKTQADSDTTHARPACLNP